MIFLPFLVAAAAAAAETGYVVRVDSQAVWLDLTAADGAAPGRTFQVYDEGAELKHPVTGASLGRVERVVARGTITDVAARFSTGALLARDEAVKAGQRARWSAPAPRSADAAPAGPPGDAATRAPKTRGAALDYLVNAMAVGDFDGAGRPQIALASDDSVRLYEYPATDARPIAETTFPDTGLRVVGLDAADLDGDRKAELFVSVYDQAFRRFETRVLRLVDGRWRQDATLPFLTRGYQDPTGQRRLATQQVIDDKTFPFGAIYPLVYDAGRYAQDRPALKPRRVDWVYGFTTAQLGAGEPASLFLTSVHALRLQFPKGWWRTPEEDYGQTPVRIRWNDRLLEFNPPMAATYGAAGFEALYAVRNMAALGGLASPFGLFNRAELLRQRWDGLALETAWRAELSGCAQGLAVVDVAPGRREIAVAVRGSAGRSSVWTYDP